MQLTGAEIIVRLLERQGITIAAGIPGGANLPLYDALYNSTISHILARHEQSAGFIAQGISRTTGKVAVCFATSGPGVTNLLTAIADAKLDSIPIVAITGQVGSALIGTDAFQEVDTYGMTIPITKHNFLIRSIEELFTVIPEAFRIASSGRPGPVLIDVPKDIQQMTYTVDNWPDIAVSDPVADPDIEELKEVCELIKSSKRPVLYIGGGIVHSGASEILMKFAHKNSIPIVSTLMALGCVPCDDPLNLGMLGMHGALYTNRILRKADLLMAFGVRFDDRATGKVSQFCSDAKIVHIDIDKAEFHKIKRADVTITSDIGKALHLLTNLTPEDKRTDWNKYIAKEKSIFPFPSTLPQDPLHPYNIIRTVDAYLDHNAIICTDVGQHQMWVAQHYPFKRPRTLLTSGGLGTMGFGLPTAIGAALANPDKRVVCFSGDGSILMNIQELATLAENDLNVTIILFNNGQLGLVRQQQELFYNKNYMACRFLSNPDFCTIAQGFGVRSCDLGNVSDINTCLRKALTGKGPCFVNAPIEHELNVLPMVPPGAANFESIGG